MPTAAAPQYDQRTEGTAVASLGLDVGVVGPDTSRSEPTVAPGLSLQLVTKRTKMPFMVGLGAGFLTFEGASSRGPVAGYRGSDGSFHIGRTSAVSGIEIRHAELLLRVEPFWGTVRPFVEGLVGFAALWHVDHLENADGDVILDNDRQRDFAALYGASVGIDWRLLETGRHSKGTYGVIDLVLTTGVRRMYTSPIERPDYGANEAGEAVSESSRAPLAIWQPFIAISLGFDTRAETRKMLQERVREATP